MSDQDYLALYKNLVATKLPLANNPQEWRQRDLEALAALIHDKSGVRLSLSTLKRIWRPDFNQTPHPTTLDALASALDYPNWLEFKRNHQTPITIEAPPVINNNKYLSRKVLWMVAACALVVLLILGLMPKSSNTILVKAKGPVYFSADKTVATGVPNTVIFKYDVSQIEADSFFLQQSWNKTHKQALDASSGYFSSTYYTPGFHRAKLLANDSIFKRVKVHIKTNGWLPSVRYSRDDLVPIYLRDPAIIQGKVLSVTPEQLKTAGVDLNQNFILSYHNVREFDGLHSDNFELSTRVKSDSLGNYACPQATITILCEEHIFYVPLTSKGCVGNLAVKFGETIHQHTNSDLSAFGRNLYQWQDIRIRVKEKQATVWVNDVAVYESAFKQDFGQVMGVVITFKGAGAVDGFALRPPVQTIAAY